MVDALRQVLLAPDNKPKVIEDCYALLDQEVSDLSGASGAAIKVAHKTVITFAPGHVRHMVKVLLPDMLEKLEPYWADFSASGGSGFGDYLAKRGDEVSQALLAVTDAHAAESGRPTIIRAYRAVRGSAARHVEAALPRVGDLVLKYMT